MVFHVQEVHWSSHIRMGNRTTQPGPPPQHPDSDIRVGKRTKEAVLQPQRQEHGDKKSATNKIGINSDVPMRKGVEKLVGKQAYSFAMGTVLQEKEICKGGFLLKERGQVIPLIHEENVD